MNYKNYSNTVASINSIKKNTFLACFLLTICMSCTAYLKKNQMDVAQDQESRETFSRLARQARGVDVIVIRQAGAGEREREAREAFENAQNHREQQPNNNNMPQANRFRRYLIACRGYVVACREYVEPLIPLYNFAQPYILTIVYAALVLRGSNYTPTPSIVMNNVTFCYADQCDCNCYQQIR